MPKALQYKLAATIAKSSPLTDMVLNSILQGFVLFISNIKGIFLVFKWYSILKVSGNISGDNTYNVLGIMDIELKDVST